MDVDLYCPRCAWTGKCCYGSRSRAKKVAKILGRRFVCRFRPWWCAACGRWHLAKRSTVNAREA